MSLYVTLNVPVTSPVAPQTVHWTADGQLCLVTKSSAYIVTPDHGINFDTDSIIRPSLGTKDKDTESQIGWFRTIIQFDKVVSFKWPEHSQEWGTLSLGLMDPTLCAVVFSPSGLLSEAGCIAATLGSNMDLFLWAPVKNFLKGEWKQICEVTPLLLRKLRPSDHEAKGSLVLAAEIASITWSQQCDFGYNPSPMLDGSLLIAGNRAGSIVFLRFLPEGHDIELVNVLDVSDTWVTHVAVTTWNTAEQGQCVSYLAYGTADGSIGAVRLTQRLSQKPSPYSQRLQFLQYGINLKVERLSSLVHESDEMGITALQWVNSTDREILVHCTPGLIRLHYPSVHVPSSSTMNLSWTVHSIRLKAQHTSTASSSLYPPSGITYLPLHDRLMVILSDGSINVLQGLSTGNPSLVEGDRGPSTSAQGLEPQPTSKMLSVNARSIFAKIEQGDVDKHDMNKITGITGYDPDNGVFVWSHEVHRPGDFSYKHDAKQKAALVVANLWGPDHGSPADRSLSLLRQLQRILESPKAAFGQAPLNILRPILFLLRDGKILNSIHGPILDILSHDVPGSDDIVTTLDADLGPEKGKRIAPTGAEKKDMAMRRGFRQSLVRHLYGWAPVLCWRLRLGLTDYLWKLSDSPEQQVACGAVALNLLDTITRHIYRTLLKHVLTISLFLTSDDLPFSHRLSIIVQSLPGSTTSPDLVNVAQQLLQIMKEVAPEGVAEESCPACGVEIPLADIRGAICSNGHAWTRCSVTTFILSTAYVRTCIGCQRKAFLAPSAMGSMYGDEEQLHYLPFVAKGWVVGELLEAAQRCLFCGNAFVCIV